MIFSTFWARVAVRVVRARAQYQISDEGKKGHSIYLSDFASEASKNFFSRKTSFIRFYLIGERSEQNFLGFNHVNYHKIRSLYQITSSFFIRRINLSNIRTNNLPINDYRNNQSANHQNNQSANYQNNQSAKYQNDQSVKYQNNQSAKYQNNQSANYQDNQSAN